MSAKCSGCGNPLPPDHIGPCPACGKKGKVVSVTMKATTTPIASLSWKSTHEFYEKNPVVYWANILIAIISPLVGLFLTGYSGVVAGLIFGVVSYFLGPKAVTKVREIRRG